MQKKSHTRVGPQWVGARLEVARGSKLKKLAVNLKSYINAFTFLNECTPRLAFTALIFSGFVSSHLTRSNDFRAVSVFVFSAEFWGLK